MTTDLKGLERKLDNLANDITGRALRKVLDQSGVEGKKIGERAVRAVLGDLSFSRWRPGRPVNIRIRYDHLTDTSIEFRPAGKAGGPGQVLQSGRRGGNHGTTVGKRWWSDAKRDMERQLPEPVGEHVRMALRKQFGG